MKATAKMFRPNPTFAIWGMDSLPLAKTLAFGPVPEGSIKAQEAAMVAGTIKRKGWIPAPFESPAKTGKNTAVVAVFEFISVKKPLRRQPTQQ